MQVPVTPRPEGFGPSVIPGSVTFQPAVPQSPFALSDVVDSYAWCIDAGPSIRETVAHLLVELDRFEHSTESSTSYEIALNVCLLACAISDASDDYTQGQRYDFSKVNGVFSFLSPITAAAGSTLRIVNAPQWREWKVINVWRAKWEDGVNRLIRGLLLRDGQTEAQASIQNAKSLLAELRSQRFLDRRPRIPAAFRSQDLTHYDVFTLGDQFVQHHPDKSRTVLVLGLRTAGSYFAPLLRAYLHSQGYTKVDCVTVRPNRGVSKREGEVIARCAARGCSVAIIDEPVASGKTFAKAVSILRARGVTCPDISILMPIHPNGRNWKLAAESHPLTLCNVFTLTPEQWHKRQLLDSETPSRWIEDYYRANGNAEVAVDEKGTEHHNRRLALTSEAKYHTRLKRVFAVHLGTGNERKTRYVIAKSVGWGWLGYHALISARHLGDFVPQVLGLREGILFSEWVGDRSNGADHSGELRQDTERIAAYVAQRAQKLKFARNTGLDVNRERQLARGLEELAGTLAGVFGKAGGVLKRARIKQDLVGLQSHTPVLIDGKMKRLEWVRTPEGLVKTDYEHHGIGKHQLNMTDPAFDLADAILHWNLSAEDEDHLLKKYCELSGDTGVRGRLILQKLLAGTWSMARALEHLNDPKMLHRAEEFNQQYVESWTYLIVQMTRFCGQHTSRPTNPRWRSSVAVLDLDGVVDKGIFGFPSTTMAGMTALSLLHGHGFAVALNTARSVMEVKEYCRAYGCVGGVSEYGAHVWDAVSGEEQVLVSEESLAQLEQLRQALRKLPGVFLNDNYRYCVRAYTFDRGQTVAIPKIQIQNIVESMNLDRLIIHQTFLDTTVVARDTDKGRGMLELLKMAGASDSETYAIGDSAPDLPMFRHAGKSYAPGHISCGATAKLLGCRVSRYAWQPGLLDSVHAIVHQSGGTCLRCKPVEVRGSDQERYLLNLLSKADRKPSRSLLLAMLDPKCLQTFLAD